MARKSTLGSLLINLELQTATLNKQVNTINKKFDKMAGTFKKVGVALAGAFAVQGMVSMINNTLKMNDALGKTADRLGIVVEDLQGLHFASEQSGVGIATLEMALQRMTRRVSEAGNGTGEAVNALKEMGIEATALANMGVSEQFDVLADALNGVENEADQVRLAMKLFDSEGVKLLNMMKDGSAGLRDYKNEAIALGFVLDRDMIAKLEMANNSLNKVAKVGLGFKNVLTVALAPAIKILSEQFITFVSNGKGATTVLQNLQKVVYGLVKGFEIFKGVLDTSISGWTSAFLYLETAVQNMMGNTEKAKEVWTRFNAEVVRGRNSFNALAGTLVGINPTLIALEEAFTSIPPKIDKIGGSITNLDKSVYDTKNKFKDIEFVFTNAFSNMENSIVEFAKTGKASFSDFANAILEDLLRMIIRLQITIPLMQGLQSAMGGGGMLGGLLPMAKGGAFQGGVQAFASGGVVSSPTLFPMAKGVGLMGEAGAEAIMPLTRTANGDLGVKGIGGGSSTVVNIYNESGSDAEVTETSSSDGGRVIDVMITSAVKKSMGAGEFDQIFASNYNLSRRGY